MEQKVANIIIGTAGHVDHGKTTLIKALTGIDTDRWEEEKRRGMSIGLGFAYFQLPDGSKAGIIDVPGHERFIRNMLTGVWGMDMILLVVDAVEGVRRQTIEHLDIIDLLGISTGIVVITKIDMVPQTRTEEVIGQVKKLLRGKLLDGSPLVLVSSVTGQGLDELKRTIISQMGSIKPPRRSFSAPRLPIDRVFVMPGFGVVVTGTLIGGNISRQESVNIMPARKKARVRGIEVHGQQVDTASPGQRVALNLSGIGREDVNRGDVVTSVTLLESTDKIDTVLEIADSCNRVLENWTRVRFYSGTSEVFGRAVLLSTDEGLLPGDREYVQFRLERPVFVFRGDRFIIRDFANQETLGGGEILNPFPSKHKRLSEEAIQELKRWEIADDVELVKLVANTSNLAFMQEDSLKYYLPYASDKQEELLKQMEGERLIIRMSFSDKRMFADTERIKRLHSKIIEELSQFHKERPLAEGANYSKIRAQLNVDEVTFDLLLQELIKDGKVSRTGNFISLTSHEVTFAGKLRKISQEVEQIFQQRGFSPPDEKELVTMLSSYNEDDVFDVFQALLRQGKLVRISDNIVLHISVVENALQTIRELLRKQKQMTMSEFRQLMNTSRKYAVPFMEYCDKIGVTVREGDFRRLKETEGR